MNDSDRTWFAIRTAASAQRPVGKGDISHIEVSLARAGFDHYMPIEHREFRHHRTKKLIEKRLPLLPGYVLVADVIDWIALCDCSGVAAVVGVAGRPLRIPASDFNRLRQAEAEINELIRVDKQLRRLRRRARKKWAWWKGQLTNFDFTYNLPEN